MSTFQPRTATVILYQGDDDARARELKRAIETAATHDAYDQMQSGREPKRLGDDPARPPNWRTIEAARAFDEFADEANERGVQVRLQALPRRKARTLLAAHPPREDVKDTDGKVVETYPDDKRVGFNTETLPDALVGYVDPEDFAVRTVVAVSGDIDVSTPEALCGFLDALADAQWDELYDEAYALNWGTGPDPKARLSSRLDPMSSETSRSPERMG